MTQYPQKFRRVASHLTLLVVFRSTERLLGRASYPPSFTSASYVPDRTAQTFVPFHRSERRVELLHIRCARIHTLLRTR